MKERGNFKVRCLRSFSINRILTVGKVYEFKNGKMTFDDGHKSFNNYYSIEEVNNNFYGKFELVKEENVNNYADEVISAITDKYGLDKSLVVDILRYLNNNTSSNVLGTKITEALNRNGICEDCGGKLQTYSYIENEKELTLYYCPKCEHWMALENIKREEKNV